MHPEGFNECGPAAPRRRFHLSPDPLLLSVDAHGTQAWALHHIKFG